MHRRNIDQSGKKAIIAASPQLGLQ